MYFMWQYMGQIMSHLGVHHTPQLNIFHVLMQQNNSQKSHHYHATHISFSFAYFKFACTPWMYIIWNHTCIPLDSHDLSFHAHILTLCKGKTISYSKLCSSCSKLPAFGCKWRRLLDSLLFMVAFGTICPLNWVFVGRFYSL